MDEVLQDGCHQADDDNGGGDNAQGSGYAAQESGLLVAHIGGGIDGDNAGRALSNRVHIQQFLVGAPFSVFHDLPLEHGKHGEPSSERKAANFKETDIEFSHFF